VLLHPDQEVLKQNRTVPLPIYDHVWQNADPPQMFDEP